MATRLETLGAEVTALLANAAPGIISRYTINALNEHDQIPRLVWLTDGGSIDNPKSAGGGVSSGARHATVKLLGQRVQVHFYADTDENVEILLMGLVAALTTVFPAGSKFAGYKWITQEAGNEGRSLRAQKGVLFFMMPTPVVNEIAPMRTVTSAQWTATMLTTPQALEAWPVYPAAP